MAEIIVSTTVLILIVLILRRVTMGRISMGMRYALWLLVAVRLLMPVSFGNSPVSVLNLVRTDILFENVTVNRAGGHTGANPGEDADAKKRYHAADNGAAGTGMMNFGITADAEGTGKTNFGNRTDAEVTGNMNFVKLPDTAGTYKGNNLVKTAASEIGEVDSGLMADADGVAAGKTDAAVDDTAGNTGNMPADGIVTGYVFLIIWIAGMVITGGYMLIGQVRLVGHLRRIRKAVSPDRLPDVWASRLEKHRMQVYTVAGLPSPCMAGRSIYILPELLEDREQLAHVLAHEYAHGVQKDTLWAFLRSVLCAVYWFYPFAWVTAYEAKQDSELAADERAIGLLGEPERYAYGRTLLAFLGGGHRGSSCTGMVLTMDGSGKRIKERVFMIAGKKKKSSIAAGVVVLIMLLACGCSFTGAEKEETDAAESSMTVRDKADADTDGQAENGQDAAGHEENGKDTAGREENDQVTNTGGEDVLTVVEGAGENAEVTIETKEQPEKEESDPDKIESKKKETATEKFTEMLAGTDDSGLASAAGIEPAEYYDDLYRDKKNPLEDGNWYLLRRDEEDGIDFYGLFTEEFGCRGVKTLIDGDVNTFDIPWAVTSRGIEVMMFEKAEDGRPRSFAFQVCAENTGRSEVWNLYLADRYDTGTIELYSFEKEEWQEQFESVRFQVDEEAAKVSVDTYAYGDAVRHPGVIDISEYRSYKVEKAVWDGSTAGFRFDREADTETESTITFLTTIGLKLAGEEEIQSSGLSMIECPVTMKGSFGDRECVLGAPVVSETSVCGMRRTVP
ncbi:MAG: M56 family metallopeptidase [Lachnospiraceae bacterium]|nr:M56 family metallopeptidase [Lachnospiraceae bacterium]